MKRNLYLFSVILGLAIFFGATKTNAQVTVTSSDTIDCNHTCTTLTAHLIGDVPTTVGITSDDVYSAVIPIGFTFNYYGVNYTQVVIGANGTLDFNISDATLGDPWTISGPLLGNASKFNNICGAWCDIDMFYASTTAVGSETYSTDGVAPNRKFSVTWCGCSMYMCPDQLTTQQIIIYESTNIIEVHIAQKLICTSWNPSTPPGAGGRAIIGVQNAAGTAATTAPGRDFPSIWSVPPTEAWRFTPTGGGTAYTVASIPYAPIPYASSNIYWYNEATGAYLGTGMTMTVCPTTGTLYRAAALGCSDTSSGYYFVTVSSGVSVTTTSVNPTTCGACNGSITLSSLTPGAVDTVVWTIGGVPQPNLIATVNAAGAIVFSSLCAGTYTFIVHQAACVSPLITVILTNPPISMTGTFTNPTSCGLCDGTITLNGLYPSTTYTVTYTLGGTPQPSLTITTNAAGSYTLTGLCPGTYANIIATLSAACITPPIGPFVLVNPGASMTGTFTNPATCGACDGTITLNGLTATTTYTLTFTLGGVAQPPLTITTNAAGSYILTGLCAGTYANIIATLPTGCGTPPIGPFALVNPPISMTAVFTNPSICGACDGSITLNGLYATRTYTVTYTLGGSPHPPVVLTTNVTGSMTLTGLCAGVYTNIIATLSSGCVTPPVGPLTLVNPPISMTATTANPTICGACDGTITLNGLYASTSFIINYSLGGLPHAPVTMTSSAAGTIVLTGLCAGTYSNITAAIASSAGSCITPAIGPFTLVNPAISMTSTTTNPTICGACDGTITLNGLYASTSFIINYIFNGTAHSPLTVTSSATGSITLSGLCAGTYSGITATIASSAGACITPALGPLVLSNPAISMTATTTNPTFCGACDGTITLGGLYASTSFIINYNLGGTPQPAVTTTTTATGTITFTGLCAGTYSNITAAIASSAGACITPAIGPLALINPPITMTATTTNPTFCGACDGTITFNGLYASTSFIINYSLGGIAQPALTITSNASGSITLTGLCAGTYTNITATIASSGGACVTPAIGPLVLANPPITMTGVPTNNSYCGVCDGKITLNGLYPSTPFTISYSLGGIPQGPFTFTTDATGSITLSGLCAGTYSNVIAAIAASSGACITPAIGPFTIVPPPLPNLNIVAKVNPSQCGYCDGTITIKSIIPLSVDTVFYTYNGATTPTAVLSSSLGDSSIVLVGLCTGVYTGFTVKDGDCLYNVIGTATLTTTPVVAAFDTAITFGCDGDLVKFTNASTPSPGASLSYTWHFGDGSIDTTKNPTHVFPQGVYTVSLIATNNLCADTTEQTLTLFHPLLASFTETPILICQGQVVNFTNTTTVTVSNNATPATSAGNYQWAFGNGATQTTQDATYTFTNSGTYTVTLTATDWIPCTSTAQNVVQVDTISPAKITMTDTVFCQGTYITFTGDYAELGNTGNTWNFGDGGAMNNTNPIQHGYGTTGVFTISVTADYRVCPTVTTSRSVTILPQPYINLGADTTICKGSESLVIGDPVNGVANSASWTWNTGATSPSIVVTEPGYYYATVNIGNCYASDTVWVKNDCYLNLPNVFSPNGDGMNDFFFPRDYLSRGLIKFSMNIYNRWGQLVFETTTLDGRGWDGKLNNTDQPEGVYVYVIDAMFKDGQKEHHQGNVTLLR